MKAPVVFWLAPAWEKGVPESLNPVYQPCTVTDILMQHPLGSIEGASVLVLWATPLALGDALELIRCWGYRYQTTMCWHIRGTTDYELGVIAWKHRFIPPLAPYPTLLTAPPCTRTRIPRPFYDALTRAYPNATRYDRLAFQPPSGWQPLSAPQNGASSPAIPLASEPRDPTAHS